MKKLTIIAAFVAALISLDASAQRKGEAPKEDKKPAYTFTDTKLIEQSPVKNQGSSGTCWSYSGIGFIESELIRKGKGVHDLSDMWIVRHTYFEKAVKYARMHGTINLSAGGATHDVFNMIDKYGIVPEEVYEGLNYGTDINRHGELDAAIKGYMDAIIRNPNGTLSTGWEAGLNGILDAYLGALPTDFVYNGKQYTPSSFASELGIKGSDYVSVTSFTHHPYGSEFAVEVPDNWAWGVSVNLPLADFMALIDRCLNSGVAVLWASDVSEKGFKYNDGFAVLPETNLEKLDDSEKAKWSALTPAEIARTISDLQEPVTEIDVTPELRQLWFDNYTSTDDHGMVLCGVAEAQNGQTFYRVKNSWSDTNIYKGYFYVSQPFVMGKTMNIMVPLDMLSK
ncbi:MAG: C1 family peptidase [Rikenellaceae bacterium]